MNFKNNAVFKSLLVFVLICLFTVPACAEDDKEAVSITILYDNYDVSDSSMETDWGFSAVVYGFDKGVLFDTGTKGEILLRNMKKAGVDPKDIDVIILSHLHHDHVGGLSAFLKENHEVTIYIPASFPDTFRKPAIAAGAKIVDVKEQMEILPGLFTTGEMGKGLIEQSIFFDNDNSAGIVTGCAHPGVENIVAQVRKAMHKDVGVLVGGFHLMSASQERLDEIIAVFEKSGVKKLLATHCTGDKAREYFKKHFGDRFLMKGLSQTIGFGK